MDQVAFGDHFQAEFIDSYDNGHHPCQRSYLQGYWSGSSVITVIRTRFKKLPASLGGGFADFDPHFIGQGDGIYRIDLVPDKFIEQPLDTVDGQGFKGQDPGICQCIQ